MDDRPLILAVDDQENIRSALNTLLGRAGFRVELAHSASTAMEAVRRHNPDLVLLDVVLDESTPNALSGLDVLRAIRTLPRFIPVIMLTSYTEWQVESLGQGAIAFCTKPWEANALISQIRTTLNAVAAIRQDALRHASAAAPNQDIEIHIDDLVINLTHYRVTKGSAEIDFTPLEFALLAFLARHPNREWTREQLLNQVWGYEWVGYERTVDRHIAAIRRKLKLQRDELIETVHGLGYRVVT
jgi:two-component system response regulator MtrA